MSKDERFTCTVERDGEGRVQGIEITGQHLDRQVHKVRVQGPAAERLAGPLHEVLNAGRIGSRSWSSSRPLDLDQVTGAHALLLIRAVKPLRRADRIDRVAQWVAGMSREEASYWHAKASRAGGLRALRILLSANGWR
jgi:hypothetical protein